MTVEPRAQAADKVYLRRRRIVRRPYRQGVARLKASECLVTARQGTLDTIAANADVEYVLAPSPDVSQRAPKASQRLKVERHQRLA
jgi:hypothetical protein